MPFGIGKNKSSNDDPADDAARSRLFGSKKSGGSAPAPQSGNPYAVQNSNPDPYSKPASYASSGYGNQGGQYGGGGPSGPPSQQSRGSGGGGYGGMSGGGAGAGAGGPPPAYGGPPPGRGGGGYGGMASSAERDRKSPVPPGGYGGGRSGYGPPPGGAGQPQGGYGSSRYGDSSGGYGGAPPKGGAGGGYGGMGRTDSDDADAKREQLFGGAAQRYQERQRQGYGQQQQGGLPPGEEGSGIEDSHGEYGGYQERQLTAEEEEEEEVQGAKDEIRFIKQQDVSSTRNALRIAEQAEQTGRDTLERLAQQGERIHNTEQNLDLASNQNRLATEKAKELKHLNRSMWAMQVNNPFTKSKRKEERDQAVVDKHMYEREQRDKTRQAAYGAGARHAEQQRNLRDPLSSGQRKANLAERSKYQFEADSDDERMEDEIDSNLDALHGAAGRLHKLGLAMGDEVDAQNKTIGRVADKADDVDLHIAVNKAKLDRIR